MQMSYQPNIVDDELLLNASKLSKAATSPRKIVIGRRPTGQTRTNSVSGSNDSVFSGLSGSLAGSIKNSLPNGLSRGHTATPNRGPGRFVAVNMSKNTGAKEVAKRTELVMKNLRNLQQDGKSRQVGVVLAPQTHRSLSQSKNKENVLVGSRVQSNSPNRAGTRRLPLSPVKGRDNFVLNELTEEFSPSPVKRFVRRDDFNLTNDTVPIVEAESRTTAAIPTSTGAKAFVAVQRVDTNNAVGNVPDPSNSPVGSECYVSIPRVDLAKYSVENGGEKALEPIVSATHTAESYVADEVCVQNLLPRASDAFQPTPVRFTTRNKSKKRVINKEKVAQVDENVDNVEASEVTKTKIPFVPGASRHSEADLGFKPPQKAMSELSEVQFNFKKPSIVIAPSSKRKDPPENLESVQGDCRYLQSWIPRLRNKRLYVEGDLLDLDKSSLGVGSDQRWVTSRIVKRISNNRIATKKGTVYVLEGNLVVRNAVDGDKLSEDGPTPNFIMDKFKEGFPENWERLLSHWMKFNDQSNINATNMSVFNSTSMTNMSMSNMTNLQNISSISSTSSSNASRFVNRTRLPSNLTVNKAADISILPGNDNLTMPLFEVIRMDQNQSTSIVRNSRRKKKSVGRNLSSLAEEEIVNPGKEVSCSRSKSDKNQNGGGMDRSARSRSPMKLVSTQPVHRSRSKTVKPNENSSRKINEQDISKKVSPLEVTMTQLDFTLLRAKSYDNTVMVNKKKNYSCHFCTFLTPVFNSLKLHIKVHHLEQGEVLSPDRRAQSNESLPTAPTPARPKPPRRSSFSPSKVARARLELASEPLSLEGQLLKATVSKNNFYCQPCEFKTKAKSGIISHLKSKKHAESNVPQQSRSSVGSQLKSMETSGSEKTKRSKQFVSRSPPNSKNQYDKSKKSPCVSEAVPVLLITDTHGASKKSKSRNRQQKSRSPSEKRLSKLKSPPGPVTAGTSSVQKGNPRIIPGNAKPFTESSKSPVVMNTPALSTYLCKACNYSTSEDVEMFNHLMCGDHSKIVTKCNSKSKLLTCSLCSFSTNRKDDLIKHMRTKTHIKTLTKYKNSDVTKSAEKSSAEVNPPKIQSRFGRNLKKTKARESCIYDTPEEVGLDPVPTKRSKQANNSKNVKSTKSKAQEVVSPRRKVMNPFKNVENVETVNSIKPVKSMEDILEKISANPKTVKQRQQNAEALKEYNENHEDDIFGGSSKPASKSTLIKSSTTLLSQDSDSDSEQDISVHSARTPMTSYFGSRRGLALTTPMLNQDRTPGILTQDSPIVPVPVNGERFQNQAYIHRKVAEKMKVSRNLKRHKLASALKVVSRTEADKMVDESSQVINTITNHTASLAEVAEEIEESEEWFDDDQENLSCDPGRGLMELLAKKP